MIPFIKIKPTSFYLISMLSLFLFCCSKQADKFDKEIMHNEVNIVYDIYGDSNTTVLFVHGWCIDKTYWINQVEYFSRDHTVITMDLPGHGKSGDNRNSWNVEDYAGDVNALITQLDLKNVVLVGHSMSGDIVLEAALNNPERITGIIGVDNLNNVGYNFSEEDNQSIARFLELLSSDYAGTVEAYANHNLFHAETDTLVRNRVIDNFVNSNPEIATATLKGLFEYGQKELDKLRKLNKRIALVNSASTPTDTTIFNQNNIDYKVFFIQGTGHYPMMEKPDHFNTALAKAIKHITGSAVSQK